MSLRKNLVAAAVLAGLAISATAQATVVLGVDPPRTYAAELIDGTTLSDTGDDIAFNVGYNFSAGEVRYGRFECSTNMTMDNVVVANISGVPTVALGALNGEGTSALFFSMTGDGNPSEADTISVDADNILEDGGDVQCRFSIYDHPSQAQGGGDVGLVHTSDWETVIARAPGIEFQYAPFPFLPFPLPSVADVEYPAGAYFGFAPPFGGAAGVAGEFSFIEVAGVLNENGAQILLTDILDADSTVTVAGDFSAALDVVAIFSGVSASFDDDSAAWNALDIIGPGLFLYLATEADPIQESDYEATLHAVANPGFEVADIGPVHIGRIIRNGTRLQAPLVQVPEGWPSRVALTNTGNVDREYMMELMTEAGVSAAFDTATGTIPAGGTVVIDLPGNLQITDSTRATINVTVAAPDDQIQGVYQITNQASGSISNHVMVRPGTN
ncbi:MAG: hypothetical protein M3Y70_02555 [Pseudomonadota bacterium]|nr:hypothetical protein [Pseudomonadota bacterium]